MKTAIALLAFAACATAFCQSDEKKITLEMKASQIDKVLKEITKQAGTPYVADQQMKPEILLISVKDANLSDVLKEIAKVTDGSWQEMVGEQRLVPNNGVRTKEAQAIIKARTAAITKMLAGLSQDDPTSQLWSQQAPSTLAELEPGQRVVFSSNPNSEQISADGISEDFVAFALTKSNVQIPQVHVNRNETQAQAQEAQRLVMPAKVTLAVANLGLSLQATMAIYNGRGVEMATGSQNREVKLAATAPDALPDSISTPDTAAVETSPVTKELWAAGFGKSRLHYAEFTADTLDALKHPDAHDPLSLYASDALLQRAKECNMQLVADLPDSIVCDKEATAKDYLSKEITSGQLAVKDDHGYMQISPARPILSRENRADRNALAALLAAATSDNRATLEDQATFAVANGHAPIGLTSDYHDASEPYLKGVLNDVKNFQAEANRFYFLALYGAMTDAQRRQIVNDQPVAFQGFSPLALAIVNQIVFGAEATLRLSNGDRSDTGSTSPYVPGQPLRPRRFDPATRMLDRSYLREPTEDFPSGFSPQATFGESHRMNPAPTGTTLSLELRLLPQVQIDTSLNNAPNG
jgi:hypothetical protein